MVSIFEERNVRIICSKNRSEIWFSAIDVGEELGIANIRDTLRNIDRSEKKKFTNEMISGVGVFYTRNFNSPLNNYGETFVSEEAVYNMAFRSNKPESKQSYFGGQDKCFDLCSNRPRNYDDLSIRSS